MENQIRIQSALSLTAILLAGQIIYAQPQAEIAPVNPEFVKYLENNKPEAVETVSGNYHGFGYIPSPAVYHQAALKKQKRNVQFDAVYDLRSKGYVTPVKNQGVCGACWAFASMGSVESNWLKFHQVTFDLSEQNLRTCSGFEYGSCTKGNAEMAAAYFARYSGPVLESDDTYNVDSTAACINDLPLFSYVSDFRYISNDSLATKQAIMDYGAVTAAIYYNDAYFNSSTKTYYYSGGASTNHVVLLVGWNNNKVTAGGTGAWIAKNSWGIGWGENGYFYISYKDSKVLTENAFFPTTVWDSGFFVCGYDKLGMTSSLGYGNETAYCFTKFKTNMNQRIVSVSTYVNTAGSTIDIDIYHNFSTGILYNPLGSLYGLSCDLPGYYTFNLTTPVTINANDSFYIKVNYATPGYNYPIPTEAAHSGYANPTVFSGVNWISYDGVTWSPVGNATYNFNLCIKYGVLPDNLNGMKESTASAGYDLYPNPIKNELTLEQIKEEKIDILISNVTGQIVMHKQTYQNITKIDMSNLAKGIYIVELSTRKNLITKKIIKE